MPLTHDMGHNLEETYKTGGSSDVSMGTVLERPVLLTALTENVGSRFNTIINPWQLWKENPVVKRRLEGFRHVRGHLCLHFTVNGSPMMFGDVICSYEPRASRSMHRISPVTSRANLVQLSQMPHVYLDPTSSLGGEMVLPFFCPENYLDTINADSFRSMGSLRIRSLAPLRHANSASGQVSINVFAWMKNSEVCTPTAESYDIYDYQSGGGEYGASATEKVASAVAKTSKALAKVPLLEPYAMATEMAATALGHVAHIFGFSRPQVTDNPRVYREFRMGQLASSTTHEVVAKLAYDAKNQLTVDSRTVGLDGTDEMNIAGLVVREALVDSFEWNDTDSQGTVLRKIRVNPVMYNRDSTLAVNSMAMSPSMFCSLPFQYWRGTMIFRFRVMASTFHRGRLRISYEPTAGNSVGGMNEVYSRIIDIETNRDIEVPIEWHASQPWLQCRKPIVSSTDTPFGTTITGDPLFDNGMLTVSVMNSLESPNPALSAPVTILIGSRGDYDLEFAVPYPMSNTYSFRSGDPAIEPQSALEDQEEQADMPETAKTIEPVGDYHFDYSSPLNTIYFGETITSMRQILRRYRVGSTVQLSDNFTVREDVINNFMPMAEYVMSAYVGWRGSFRYKLSSTNETTELVASLVMPRSGSSVLDGDNGLFRNRGNLEIEIPFYSPKRFEHTRTHPLFAANTDIRGSFSPNGQVVATGGAALNKYTAIGEDFTTFFYIGPPLVYDG